MGCCSKKRSEELNIVVHSEHFIDNKDIEEGKKINIII